METVNCRLAAQLAALESNINSVSKHVAGFTEPLNATNTPLHKDAEDLNTRICELYSCLDEIFALTTQKKEVDREETALQHLRKNWKRRQPRSRGPSRRRCWICWRGSICASCSR